MRTYCPVCQGIGSIVDQTLFKNGPVFWGGPLPRVTCPNCAGEKFVGTPDVANPLIPDDLEIPRGR
jgi:hypothetical protein